MDNSQVLNKAKCGDSESKLAKLLSLHPSFYFHSLVCVNNTWSGRVLLSTEEQWSQESLVPKPSHYPFWLLTVCKYEGERPGRSHYQIESGYTGGAVPNKESRSTCELAVQELWCRQSMQDDKGLGHRHPYAVCLFLACISSHQHVCRELRTPLHMQSPTHRISLLKFFFLRRSTKSPHPHRELVLDKRLE